MQGVEIDASDGETAHQILDRFEVPRKMVHLVLRNGVYIAELRVSYDDGGSERLLRKVAVVR